MKGELVILFRRKSLFLASATWLLLQFNTASAAPGFTLTKERFNDQPNLNLFVEEQGNGPEGNVLIYYYSNYSSFFTEAWIRVYDGTDLMLANPLQSIKINDFNNYSPIIWDGGLLSGSKIKPNQRYRFVLEVSDDQGRIDKTVPLEIIFRESIDQKGIKQISLPAFGKDRTAQRSITPSGSIWVLRGEGISKDENVTINGQKVLSDSEGNLISSEYILNAPEYKVTVSNPDGIVYDKVIRFEENEKIVKKNTLFGIPETDFFAMGLLDVTIGKNSTSGYIEMVKQDDTYDEKLFFQGRSAFFLKGKIRGKYLLTAQLDTDEVDGKDIFKKLDERKTKDFIRHIDPEAYYPVYGDDSTLQSYADSQGKFYIKLEWDKSKLLWGNYNVSLGNGNDLVSYNRTLYGAFGVHETIQTTKFDLPKTKISGFTSSSNTLGERDEMRATGGTLYYLRHHGVIPGSEQISIELRDEHSSLVIGKVSLKEDIDYTIDCFSGRIHLTKPAYSYVPSDLIISSSSSLSNSTFLVIDYEYDFNEVSPFGNNPTKGIKASQWLGDHLRIGASHIEDSKNDEKYKLSGIEIEFRPRKNSFIHYERATTDKSSALTYQSLDGGFTWQVADQGMANYTPKSSGYQWRGEFNLGDFVKTKHTIVASGYYKFREKGFSSLGQDVGTDTTEEGVAFELKHSNEKDRFFATQTYRKNEKNEKQNTALVNWKRQWSPKWETTVESKWISDENIWKREKEWLGAIQGKYIVNSKIDFALTQQVSLWQDSDSEKHNRTTLGINYHPTPKIDLGVEGFTSSQGEGGFVRGSYELFKGTKITSRQGIDYDRLEGRSHIRGIGLEQTVSTQVKAYTEWQTKNTRTEVSTDQIYGIQYQPKVGRTLDVSYTKSLVDNKGYTKEEMTRDVISLGYQVKTEQILWSGRLENREDKGENDLTQNISKHSIHYKPNKDWSLFASHDYSKSTGNVSRQVGFYNELNLGGAYRPLKNNRFNLIFKYTRLDNQDPDIQSDASDTFDKSQVFALEGVYKLSPKWSAGGKVAHKVGTLTLRDDLDYSFSARTTFTGIRLNYTLLKKWDVFSEYRILRSSTAQDHKQGFLVGAYRFINPNLKVGVGYNFTSYTDDLTRLDYKAKGWFFNLVGGW